LAQKLSKELDFQEEEVFLKIQKLPEPFRSVHILKIMKKDLNPFQNRMSW
jgi:hypothetical protein